MLRSKLADGIVLTHGDKRGQLLKVIAIMIGLALSLLVIEAALRLLPAQQELGLESFYLRMPSSTITIVQGFTSDIVPFEENSILRLL